MTPISRPTSRLGKPAIAWVVVCLLSVIFGPLTLEAADKPPGDPPAKPTAPLPADHAERMAKGLDQFQKQVAGILKEHCLKCHGGEAIKGEFDLATREGLLKGGESGVAVVPFQTKSSTLYKLITHADEPKMPDKAPKLSDEKIAQIAAWIDNGAPYDVPLAANKPAKKSNVVSAEEKKWWAFQPLAKVAPPKIDDPKWNSAVRTDIDRFIVARSAAKGLGPSPVASKRVLVRRAYLDLLGLPPTPEEVEAFLRDDSPDAWPKLIDRLLDNPHFGERWARHWLDVARFAESHGFEQDYDRPGAWAFRDFVIRALNEDLPYKKFIEWQLAGDEFEPDDPHALSATGFLGAGVFPTQITANEVERTRYDALDDMLSTTGSAFLGLTVGCARCHDHKFDPIPTHDYYRLLSTFTTTVRSNIDVDIDRDKNGPAAEKWRTEHAALEADLKKHEDALRGGLANWVSSHRPTAKTWSVLELLEVKSKAGASFKKLDDGSYLAGGTNGEQDEYAIQFAVPSRKMTGLRLEVLADKSLPKSGPGRAPNGNFGLSKISVSAMTKPGEKATAVKIAKAQASFEQNHAVLSIAASLDDDPRSGWAVDPQFGKDNAAVFTFAEPLALSDGGLLAVRLDFGVNGQHNIGRFRLSATGDDEPRLDGDSTPAEIARILSQASSPTDFEKLSADVREKLFDWRKKQDATWRQLLAKVDGHKNRPASAKTNIMICGEGYKPMRHHTQGGDFFNETHFLERGNVDRKSGVATQSFLQVLMPTIDAESKWQWKPPSGAKYSGRRRSLANWIVDVEQGGGTLAARVAVNRLWQHHFGQGIVATPNDFGRTGTAPTHPELLDWLASELIRGGWKQKPLHKLIMTSAAYMQSTTADADFKAKEKADPGNELFARRAPRRLEAEAIRDSLLSISGSLDLKMFGAGTRDENTPRRSIYFMIKRSQLIGSMVVFDQPEPLVSQGQRPTTTVAPQALLIMNGPQVRRWAESFAKRVESSSANASDFQSAVERAYRIALSRAPDENESRAAVAFLEAQSAQYAKASRANGRFVALADFCQVLFGLNELAYEE